jgi:DNA-directed RNA polymerase subunit RPC12/RpoP
VADHPRPSYELQSGDQEMKAITCTQCGAKIENVFESSLIINCDYCGARIMLSRDREQEHKPPIAPPNFTEPDASPVRPLAIAGVALIILVPIFIQIAVSFYNSEQSTPAKAYSAPATPYAYPTPSSWSVSTDVPEKPVPVVNYQPRISWDGPNDLEYFAEPQVDIASVSHLTSEEVKTTVFKNRIVKLRVVINTAGEIDEVETISGHPILVDAATASAKSTIFRSRSKPTTRVLTYTYRVLKD